MTNRKYVEYCIKRDLNADKNFDAWLYTQKEIFEKKNTLKKSNVHL